MPATQSDILRLAIEPLTYAFWERLVLLLLYLATLISRGQEKMLVFSVDLTMLRNFF